METLYVRTNKKTHKPRYIGIGKPTKDGGEILKTLYGDKSAILIPITDQEEEK
jgi:hypothetical protein